MRKILLLGSFPLIAAILWPIYVGIQVEQVLREGKSLSLAGLDVHHAFLDYHRERYRSRATSRIQVLGQNIEFQANMEHDIRHRLLGVSIESRMPSNGLHDAWRHPLQAALLEAAPRGESWVGLGGGVRSRIFSKPVQLTGGNNGVGNGTLSLTVEVGSMHGGFSYSPERAVLSLDTERLVLSNGRATVELDELHHTLMVHAASEGSFRQLPSYDRGFGVGRILLRYDAKEWFEARSLQGVSLQSTIGERPHSAVRLRGEAVRVGGFAFESMDLYSSGRPWHWSDRHPLLGDIECVATLGPCPESRPGSLSGTALVRVQQLLAKSLPLQGRLQLTSDPEHQLHLDMDWVVGDDAVALTERPLEAMQLILDLELGPRLVEAIQKAPDSMVAEMDLGQGMQRWLAKGITEGCVEWRDGVLCSLLRMKTVDCW